MINSLKKSKNDYHFGLVFILHSHQGMTLGKLAEYDLEEIQNDNKDSNIINWEIEG